MTAVRILGVGSPSGDDQAGWLVVRELERTDLIGRLRCRASILALDRPGARLIEYLEGADLVVLIDAMCSGAPPGTISRLDVARCIPQERPVSAHEFGVVSALELARALGGLPSCVLFYGIEIASAKPASRPGEPVKAAATRLAQIIARELAQRFGISAGSDAVV